jgi:uncharacterized protein (DUF1697 family)
MPRYIAFQRAINVTGRFLKMHELAAAFHALGHADARTYINSGDVIFSSSTRSAAGLEHALEERLEPHLGFGSEPFVRTAAQVQAIAARGAGLRDRAGETGEVNVCFLQASLSTAQADALSGLKTAVDDFEIHEREVYWTCLTRQTASRFSNATLERKLKLRSTLRRVSMLQGLADGL